jgi:hypothetical protein
LGKSESYRVAMAVKQLSENADHGVKTARFFGKIFGTQQDYLVCETELAEAGEATELSEEDVAAGVVPPDAPGTGCNKFVYFVCSRPGTAWTKLPDVLPAQLMAARQIKKLVTGVLDTPIEGYPVFPGTEANYLRCQIAQIAAATGIVPKGVFKGPWDEEDYEAPEVGSEVRAKHALARAAGRSKRRVLTWDAVRAGGHGGPGAGAAHGRGRLRQPHEPGATHRCVRLGARVARATHTAGTLQLVHPARAGARRGRPGARSPTDAGALPRGARSALG